MLFFEHFIAKHKKLTKMIIDSQWVHLFALILSNKLLKISFFDHERFHAVVTSERSLRCGWSKSSVSFLLVVLKNRAKCAVVKTLSSYPFNHGFNIKSKLEFPFDGFDKGCLCNGTTFIKMSSQSNKGVN